MCIYCLKGRKLSKFALAMNNCRWTDSHPDYKEIVDSIVICQRHWRRKLIRRKINMAIPVITAIYWAPDMKGGYFHKKRMMDFLEGLDNLDNSDFKDDANE